MCVVKHLKTGYLYLQSNGFTQVPVLEQGVISTALCTCYHSTNNNDCSCMFYSGAQPKLPILRLKKTGGDDDSFEKQVSKSVVVHT